MHLLLLAITDREAGRLNYHTHHLRAARLARRGHVRTHSCW